MLKKTIETLSSSRFSLNREKDLQREVAEALSAQGIPFEREYQLDDHSTVDFFINDSIALEIKIKGSAKSIYRQCEKYCKIDKVEELILLTNKSMGFPEEILGKPCYLVSPGKAWL